MVSIFHGSKQGLDFIFGPKCNPCLLHPNSSSKKGL